MAQAIFEGVSYTSDQAFKFVRSLPSKLNSAATSVTDVAQKGLKTAYYYADRAQSEAVSKLDATQKSAMAHMNCSAIAIKQLGSQVCTSAKKNYQGGLKKASACSKTLSSMVKSAKAAPKKWKQGSSIYLKAQFTRAKKYGADAKKATIAAMIYGVKATSSAICRLSFRATCFGTKLSLKCSYKVIKIGFRIFKQCTPAEHLGQALLKNFIRNVEEKFEQINLQSSIAFATKHAEHAELFKPEYLEKKFSFAKQEMTRLIRFGFRHIPLDTMINKSASFIGNMPYPDMNQLCLLTKITLERAVHQYYERVTKQLPELSTAELFALRSKKIRAEKAISTFINSLQTSIHEYGFGVLFFTNPQAVKQALAKATNKVQEVLFPNKVFSSHSAIKKELFAYIEEEMPRVRQFISTFLNATNKRLLSATKIAKPTIALQNPLAKTMAEHSSSICDGWVKLVNWYFDRLVDQDSAVSSYKRQQLKKELDTAKLTFKQFIHTLLNSFESDTISQVLKKELLIPIKEGLIRAKSQEDVLGSIQERLKKGGLNKGLYHSVHTGIQRVTNTQAQESNSLSLLLLSIAANLPYSIPTRE